MNLIRHFTPVSKFQLHWPTESNETEWKIIIERDTKHVLCELWYLFGAIFSFITDKIPCLRHVPTILCVTIAAQTGVNNFWRRATCTTMLMQTREMRWTYASKKIYILDNSCRSCLIHYTRAFLRRQVKFKISFKHSQGYSRPIWTEITIPRQLSDKESEIMGGAWCTNGWMHTKFCSENLKGRDHSKTWA
jgi:hypothetical protein